MTKFPRSACPYGSDTRRARTSLRCSLAGRVSTQRARPALDHRDSDFHSPDIVALLHAARSLRNMADPGDGREEE